MRLLLIGAGNIGGALLKGWSESNLFEQIVVVQPSCALAPKFEGKKEVLFVSSPREIPKDLSFDLSVIAIKPQVFQKGFDSFIAPIGSSIVVSLMAGINFKELGSLLVSQPIVRIMPNVGISVGKSIHMGVGDKTVSSQTFTLLEQVFGLSGRVFWLDCERKLDELTPILGSGPAYFFLLAKVLAQKTMEMGIDEDLAHQLASQVLSASGLLTEGDHDFDRLITSVARKGGVTEVILEILAPSLDASFDQGLCEARKWLEKFSS